MSILKIVGIAAGIVAAGLAGLAVTNSGNVAETSADAKDESLQTRHYQVNFDTFVDETKKIIPTLTTYGKKWKLSGDEINNQQNSAAIKAEIPVVFFIDDMEISAVKEAGKDEIKVNVRSSSRVGKSDLGENKRHVRQFLDALDEKFGRK